MNNIAIIPARCGSKGLKDKNIKPICGKPLLAYTIEAALESGVYDIVMVSTDSEDYAQIAKAYGAEVPFFRSEKNSSDIASSWDVVREVLSFYSDNGLNFDMFTLLQPTSPMRTSNDITNAYSLYKHKDATAVISVCEMEHSPLWSNVLPESLSMDGFLSNNRNVQRQQLDTFYRINGAIYMVSVRAFNTNPDVYTDGSFAYIMSKESSIDIDTELDFLIADAIMKRR